MQVGRNESCPCGSGKKYKKCCGLAQTSVSPRNPEVARAEALKLADRRLVDRVMRFAKTRLGEKWLDNAMAHYLGERGRLSEDDLQLAIPWAVFHYPVSDNGPPIAQVMRDDRAGQLPLDLAEVLDAQLITWLSLWEVRDVEAGVGMSLRDLLTGEERFVHEVSGSRGLVRGHALLGRVVECGGVSFFGGVHSRVLVPNEADVIVQTMRRICRVRKRPVAPQKLRDVDNQLHLVDAWRLAVEEVDRPRPLPVLANTDGDLFVQTTDHFEIVLGNAGIVSQLLTTFKGSQEETQQGDERVFVVTRPGNARMKSWDNTVIGRVVVKGTRMMAESNSTKRADALRTRLEAHLRGLVAHRLREESSQEAMLAQAAASRGTGARATGTPPELQAVARDLKETHMRGWVDEKIPALGGLTPRQAAASPRSRAALILLLRDIEHREARLPAEERFDMGRLRKTLGVEA